MPHDSHVKILKVDTRKTKKLLSHRYMQRIEENR